MSPLAFRLFGPFEVRLHGAPLPPLRTRRGRWLLALLVLRAGREVDRAWLAGTLWPESAESQTLASLRRTLTDLRSALGPEAPRLRSPTPHTVCLDLTGAEADVVAFDAAIRHGDASALEQAIALYRGPLLEGCVEEWAFPERQEREQAYLGALETLAAQAMAASGRLGADGSSPPIRAGPTTIDDQPSTHLAAAERHLRRAVAVDPLRESAQRALMQVLAAGGNYAAATQLYRELRHLLHREINAEPDAETQTLFRQLRAESRQRADIPSHCSGPTRALLPANTLDVRRHNLPVQPTPLIGREKEAAVARELLLRDDVRLLTLTGSGGTGKTRLGLQVADELLDAFSGGVFFVPLAPISDPGLVGAAIAQALGVRENGRQPLLESLKAYVREKQLLLLLDNFEQVIAAAPLIAELLASSPRLKILTTSRALLRLRGEHEFPVLPLAAPDPRQLPAPELLSQYAAVELFIQRAVVARGGFTVTNENAPAVAAICHRLDGLPLAIELAAARLKLLSPQALLTRLENRLNLLTGGARDLPARHQTLRAAIAWSYDLLSVGEKRLFQRLSVFVGGFTLEAAEAVAGDFGFSISDFGLGTEPQAIRNPKSEIPNGDVLDGLASLVDQSLLRQEESADGEPRFMMLETIREFAAEYLAASGERDAIRRRHFQFFLRLAEQAEAALMGADQVAWLERTETEHDNLRTALAWAVESGAAVDGMRLAGALGWFWNVRGYFSEGREHLARLLSQPGAMMPTSERARALRAAGNLARLQTDHESARALGEEGVTLSRQIGDQRMLASCLLMLGNSALDQLDCAWARAVLEESHTLFCEQDDPWGIAWSLDLLACLATIEEEYERAVALFEESLAQSRASADRRSIAMVLNNLGYTLLLSGDRARARGLLEEGVALNRQAGNKSNLLEALHSLGTLLRQQGDFEGARGLFEEDLRLSRDLASSRIGVYCLGGLAGVAIDQGHAARAARLFGAEEALAEAFGLHMNAAEQADHDQSVATARAVLGATSFAAAWAEGRSMTLGQAIDYALQ